MDWPARILWKFRNFWTGRESRQAFDREVDDHIQLLAARFEAQGMNPFEAMQAARR